MGEEEVAFVSLVLAWVASCARTASWKTEVKQEQTWLLRFDLHAFDAQTGQDIRRVGLTTHHFPHDEVPCHEGHKYHKFGVPLPSVK